MNEERTTQAELPIVEPAPGEKHSAVIVRGISMPAHQIQAAIRPSRADRSARRTARRYSGSTPMLRSTT